jgi:hypothetical protein
VIFAQSISFDKGKLRAIVGRKVTALSHTRKVQGAELPKRFRTHPKGFRVQVVTSSIQLEVFLILLGPNTVDLNRSMAVWQKQGGYA